MEKNVCGIDRFARAVLGVFLLGILVRSRRQTADDQSLSVSDLLTVYALAELSVNVFAQWCPLNALFDFNSCGQN